MELVVEYCDGKIMKKVGTDLKVCSPVSLSLEG